MYNNICIKLYMRNTSSDVTLAKKVKYPQQPIIQKKQKKTVTPFLYYPMVINCKVYR